MHVRYATEVVARHHLCPFLKDPESAFGHFCVVLDEAPDLALALAIARSLEGRSGSVTHIVYPLVHIEPAVFERFAADFGRALRGEHGGSAAPVLATFHPELAGTRETPHGLVGLLRHAPDPFVQLVPPGLHEGGTTLAGSGVAPGRDVAEENYARLGAAGIDEVLAAVTAIRADRDAAYAQYLETFA